MVREINAKNITDSVAELSRKAAFYLPADVWKALEEAYKKESSSLGRDIIQDIIDNDRIAEKEHIPICQDTGMVVVFIEVGQDVHVIGGDISSAVQEGVRRAYTGHYLRKSVVRDPLQRVNTGDNTPAIIHYTVVPGDRLTLNIVPKGGGSENMSALTMLPPSAGIRGVAEFVIETVKKADSNPCPPVIVGVGMGGNFETSALLAKKALLRTIGSVNPDPDYARFESELLKAVNELHIGPQGFGGSVTALAVHIEQAPCHITSIPVAVNIQCHAARHAEVVL